MSLPPLSGFAPATLLVRLRRLVAFALIAPDRARITRPLAAALAIAGAAAATADAATFTGRVRGEDSRSFLLGATATLRELNRTAVSNSSGEFTFADVPAGTYTLEVGFLGYRDFTQTITVTEQPAPRLEITLATDALTLGAMVVEGTREGQLRALQQKRSAVNVMDVISADAVGKFPDGNAAEALRRVPGISVEIDQDEGRYVVVRGIDSALNTVTLNNQLVGTPSEGGNRGVAMDSVPAELIARLEVTKAVTPDMDANAIGGSINIVTQSAFDRPEGFLYGSVSGFYDSFSERTSPNGSLTFGRLLGDDGKWGVVGAVSYSLKDLKSQTVNQRSWARNEDTGGLWLPLTQQSYDYDIERERIGANVAMQFRPAEGHELALRLNHNEFTDEEDRQSVLFEYVRGDLTNQTATSGANSQGRASRQFRDYNQSGTIDAASLEGKHEVAGDGTLSWQVGASRGERDTPLRNDWEYRSSGSAFPNTYDLSGDVAVITPVAAYYDPAQYPFRRVRFRTDLEREDVYSAQVDFQRPLELAGRSGHWKTGAKFVTREKEDDRNNRNYTLASGAANAFTLADAGLAGPEPENYFNGLFRFGPTLNMPANEAYFAANPSRFAFDESGSMADSLSSDFDATEDVLAGYALASVDLARTWTLLAGVRIEYTDTTYGAYEQFEGVFSRVSDGRDYTNVLPGVHLVWRPTPKTVVRFAWTNTLGRPNYSDLAPRRDYEVIEDEEAPGEFLGSLSTGNPDLEPYESMNFDLSAEYYLKNAGIVSVGFFHKLIDNPVYQNTVFQTDVTFDGREFTQLTTTRPENADRGRITGVELNYQQFFTFLPSPFDGFGFNVNYTLTDSSATLFERSDKLPFFKQADSIANVAVFYEKYGWEARVAYSYNDDYLDEVGSDPETDIYIRGRGVIDAKVSYRVTSHLKLFAEFLNLDEEPLREFTGVRQRENDFEIYEWKARFGVNFNL